MEHGDINISSSFFGHSLAVPILSSPMDTITGLEMMGTMWKNGGLGVHHRYTSTVVLRGVASSSGGCIAVSPSMGISTIEEIYKYNGEMLTVVMDVAHGDTSRNLEFCMELISLGISAVSGNIATQAAAEMYLANGISYLRVGVGSGSACSTRISYRCRIPARLCIIRNKQTAKKLSRNQESSDGGHKTTGDIVKTFSIRSRLYNVGWDACWNKRK